MVAFLHDKAKAASFRADEPCPGCGVLDFTPVFLSSFIPNSHVLPIWYVLCRKCSGVIESGTNSRKRKLLDRIERSLVAAGKAAL